MSNFKTIPAGRRLRVLQAGCGDMAQAWVERALRMNEVEIVGLADVKREAAERTARRFNLPASLVHNSVRDAIKAVQPDAVFDVTVPAAHCGVTLDALKSGCHVLGEKPLSDNMPCARKMCAAARKHKRLFAVTQNRRYNEHAAAFREGLKRGMIGELSSLDADFYLGPHFEGFRRAMPMSYCSTWPSTPSTRRACSQAATRLPPTAANTTRTAVGSKAPPQPSAFLK